jgi:hypothetical protein
VSKKPRCEAGAEEKKSKSGRHYHSIIIYSRVPWLTVETAGYKYFHPLEMIQIQSMGAKSQY